MFPIKSFMAIVYPNPGSSSGLHIIFCCHVSLVFFFNGIVPLAFFIFMTLIFLKGTSQVFCRCSLHVGLSDVCLLSGWDYEQRGKYLRGILSLPLMMPSTPDITGDINLDRLVKVVPAWFLHCNIGIPLPHSGGFIPS